MDTRRNSSRRFGVPTLTALLAGSALVLTPVSPPTASAAAGDYSYAFGQFLQGSLLDEIDLGSIVEIEGEEAESHGLSDDGPHYNELTLSLLDAIELPLGSGLGEIPLDTGLGVVGQYAHATRDGFSLAGAGAITNNGVMGTPDGPPPQPMEFALTDLVPVGAIADLRLTVDVVTATAEQTGSAPANGEYELDDLYLLIESPALATITTALASPTGPVAELDSALGSIEVALGGLGLVPVTVTLPDLQAVVDNIVGDPITNPAHPGLSVDLGTGEVTVDLDALLGGLGECDADGPGGEPAGLSNCPVGYEIINDVVINAIATSVTNIVSAALDELVDDLLDAINSTGITANLAGVVTIDTTMGLLTDGDPDNDGIEILGGALLVGDVIAAILDPLDGIFDPDTGVLATLNSELIAPVVSELVPAIEPVLDEVLQLIVNVQETTPTPVPPDGPDPDQFGFTQRALRVEVLPGTANLATLDLANATVGQNVEGLPFIDGGGGASGLDPDFGPDTGGTTVTVTGGNFTGADAIVLDDTDGDITLVSITAGNPGVLEPGEFQVDSDSQITFITPPNEAGPVGVVVSHPVGDSEPETFTYFGITAVSPDSGPEIGGNVDAPATHVTITGACFTGASNVLFGSVPALDFTVVSDTVITAVPPPGTGTVDITVVGTACGDIVADDAYTYEAVSIDPDQGPETGGQTVTITGDELDTVTDVTIGGVDVPFTYDDGGTPGDPTDDTIIFVTPPHPPGVVDVVVTNPTGDRTVPYEYVAVPPGGPAVDPPSGPPAGGTTVTITGECFTGATAVLFGTTPAVSFTVVSDTEIIAVAPPGTPGTVDITIVTPTCGEIVIPDAYSYGPVPPLDASRFVPVGPCRLLDTRETGEPKPTAGATRTLQVANACGVPADAISATMTLTVTETEARGHLTAWPEGAQPIVSNLNYGPNENRANSTVVRLSEAGTLQLYTHAQTHLVVDVSGYWVRSTGTTSGRFVADAPERLLDTRLPGETIFGPFEDRIMPLPAGVPSDATALAINITMDDTLGAGWMAAYPADLTQRPHVSAVNSDGEGQIRAGSLIVPVSPEGFKVVSKLGGHAVIDYLGYFTGESAALSTTGLFVPQAPERVTDTRLDPGARLAGQTSMDVDTEVPGSGVIINLTMVEPIDFNWLRAWAAGTPMPETSSVNATTELAVANLAIVGQEDSMVSVFTKVDAHVVVDVAGWFFE